MPLVLSGLYYTNEGKKNNHDLISEQTQHDNEKANNVMSYSTF